jgi:hypothetical protein
MLSALFVLTLKGCASLPNENMGIVHPLCLQCITVRASRCLEDIVELRQNDLA